MRDFVVCVVIVIVVFLASYHSEQFLIRSGNQIVERLHAVEREVEEDRMTNFAQLREIKEDWDNVESRWNMLSNHTGTDNIELAFQRLLISYEEQEKSEVLVNLAEIIALLEDTPRSEKISWENIF